MVKNKRTNSQHLFQPDFSTFERKENLILEFDPLRPIRERENQAKIHPCDLTEI